MLTYQPSTRWSKEKKKKKKKEMNKRNGNDKMVKENINALNGIIM